MGFLRKYGAATHIYIPIVKRAVVDFAVGADWTPAAGDVKISKNGGAAANVTNLPTAIAMGNGAIWDFSLTATEMEAEQVVVTVADSATKAVEDQAFVIETYGNASAQHAVDFDDAVRAGLTALPNAVFQATGGLDTPIVDSGTLQAVGANTAQLAAGAPSIKLEKYILRIKTATTGAGQLNVITDYDTTTKECTLQDSWEITPTGTITYEVLKYSAAVDPSTPADIAAAVATNFDGGGSNIINNINTQVNDIETDVDTLLTRLPVKITKNVSFANFKFYMVQSADPKLPATGLTVTAERAIDDGAFAACANAVVEIGSGWYRINLAQAETNGDCIALKFTAAGAVQTGASFVTQPAA